MALPPQLILIHFLFGEFMMTGKSIRNWFIIHKWTSLISTLFLLMLCITGLPLIFHHEIDHALGYSIEAPELPGVSTEVSLDQIIASAELRSSKVVQYVYPDEDEPEVWWMTLADTVDAAEGYIYYMYDRRTGEFIHEYPDTVNFMSVMYRLHYDMYAGLAGTLFLGFMGLLLAIALTSGVVVYGPYMKRIKFGTVRYNKSPRLKWLDLHNLLGIATLVWVMVVGVTGVVNTLAIPIFAYWQKTELATMTSNYVNDDQLTREYSVQAALETARKFVPDADVSFIAMPGNPFASPNHFSIFMNGNTPLTSKLLTPVLVEASTSKLTTIGEMPWYTTTLLLSQPLHFGDYGGMPLKILWALLDILAIIVLISGVYLWIKKRKLSASERLGLPLDNENTIDQQSEAKL